jgi:hypothetical protein
MNLNLKSELTSLLRDNDPSFAEFLEKNIKKNTINLSDFDDIIEGLFLDDPEYFMYFYYPKIHPLIKEFFPEQQVYEMEQNTFQKLSLYEGESFLTDFNGEISIPDNSVDGRIYLTNYRIVVHGILKIPEYLGYGKIVDGSARQINMQSQVGFDYALTPPTSAGAGATGGGGSGATGGTSYSRGFSPPSSFSASSYGNYEGSREIWFNLFRGNNFAGARLNKEDSFKTKPCFGYQIPIINSSKISRKKNIVKYTGTFKNLFKTKKQKIHFKISVSIPKGIKSKDFNKETEDILKVLVQTITQYSTET